MSPWRSQRRDEWAHLTLTVRDRLDPHDNGFNFLRLALATLVILSHTFPISGHGHDPKFGDITLGTMAVGGFFAISGYLITRSRMRTDATAYVWRRFLRIFPGYWACLVFTAFAAARIGGLERGGWDAASARMFVVSSLDMHGGTALAPGTLAGAPWAGSWNGSLWSLRYEVLCYVLVGLALFLGPVRRNRVLTVAAFVGVSAFSVIVHGLGLTGFVEELTLLVPFFLAGAVLFFFADTVRLTAKGTLVAAPLFLLLCVIHQAQTLGALPLAYLLLWLAVALPPGLRKVGAKRDFSYGMYLYAFPVQQLLVLGVPGLGVMIFGIASVVMTAPLAVLSWYLVESPSMRLKDIRPKPALGRRVTWFSTGAKGLARQSPQPARGDSESAKRPAD